MILNHQNLPANHQILQVALQATEQQLLILLTVAVGNGFQTTLSSQQASISQEHVDKLVTNHTVQGMRPLSTAEDESFIELVVGLQPYRKVMTRKTLTARTDEAQSGMVDRLIAAFSSVDYVCTTADIWSTNNKSYLGVTGHWIRNQFDQHSAAPNI